MAFKALCKPSRGPKVKGENEILFNQLRPLAQTFWKEVDKTNLSYILNYSTTKMVTALENNIKTHFVNHIRQFVNQSLKIQFKVEYEKDKKQISKEWNAVKSDLINLTTPLTCDKKYHTWINQTRSTILPTAVEKSLAYDVASDPQKYIKYMIAMNIELERIGGKLFQFFPLQTTWTPAHITVDTSALVDLFIEDIKNTIEGGLTDELKQTIWSRFFKFSNKCKLNGYVFDYLVQTDGYTVTLHFLNRKYIQVVKEKKEKMIKGKEAAALRKATGQEKPVIVKPEVQKDTTKPKKISEFQYIEDVSKTELEGKHIFIDPGKRSLFTMMDDDGKFYSYTNKWRLRQTKRLEYQELIQKHRDTLGITKLEEELSVHNTKTCDIAKFSTYINVREKLRIQLQPKYEANKFQQYRWYFYINTKRCEDTMLNKIEKTYSKDHKIILGDWSVGKAMKNFISTPNLGLRRKLATRFDVYLIDEFRTSCLHWQTEEQCSNLYLPDKNKKQRKMHPILTFTTESQRLGCINRDKNSCKNIRKLFNFYMQNGKRPERYCRGVKLEETVRNTTNQQNASTSLTMETNQSPQSSRE
jgi:hypothetical protein